MMCSVELVAAQFYDQSVRDPHSCFAEGPKKPLTRPGFNPRGMSLL